MEKHEEKISNEEKAPNLTGSAKKIWRVTSFESHRQNPLAFMQALKHRGKPDSEQKKGHIASPAGSEKRFLAWDWEVLALRLTENEQRAASSCQATIVLLLLHVVLDSKELHDCLWFIIEATDLFIYKNDSKYTDFCPR